MPGPPPRAVTRANWWQRLLRRLRRDRLQALNVCRNGHVIPEPGSTWCESCDSAKAFRRSEEGLVPGRRKG